MLSRKTDPFPSFHVTRRRFLQGSAVAGVGLLVGFDLRLGRAFAQTGGGGRPTRSFASPLTIP